MRRRQSKLRAFGESALSILVFDAANHRGSKYSTQDLDAMVANFRANSAGRSPMLRVPAVFGRDQEGLERSDLPAVAWATGVRRDGMKLFADLGDMSNRVKDLLVSKAYESVSAEVYDEPPDGCRGQGRMIRRVAFLGNELPVLDTLDAIADLTLNSEARDQRGRALVKFAEANKVRRYAEQHRTELARFGFSPREFERVFTESGLTARQFLGR